MNTKCVVLEYLYRDAGNYKVHGSVLLKAEPDLRLHLIEGCYFDAEKLGVPSLRERLYPFSGGSTSDDHDWHELVALRRASRDDLKRLTAIELDVRAVP